MGNIFSYQREKCNIVLFKSVMIFYNDSYSKSQSKE